MIELFKLVFDDEMFAEIHYVEENPAVVRIITILKKDGHIITDEEMKTYPLHKVDDEHMEYDLKHNFFVKLNFQWIPKSVKYFSRGLLSRIFKRQDPKRIVDLISDSDWAIMSRSVIDEIRKLPEFNDTLLDLVDDFTEIKPVGDIMGTIIYSIPLDIETRHSEKATIYTGCRKSITPIIHKTENLYTFEINNNPNIKKITLR